MTERLQQIRNRWLKGSPPQKKGVTERYVVFGEARAELVEWLQPHRGNLVMDLGFGHGFLSYQLALWTDVYVVGLDMLGGDQLKIAKGGARIGLTKDAIDWTIGDARRMPFAEGTFDAVACFLTLQDVYMTSGETGVFQALDSACRLLKPSGELVIADNLFPESPQNPSQELYSQIHLEVFHAGLPSKHLIVEKIRSCGLTNLEEKRFNPSITLDKKESRIELMDIIESRPFGRDFDFEKLWATYGNEIERIGLSYPNIIMIKAQAN